MLTRISSFIALLLTALNSTEKGRTCRKTVARCRGEAAGGPGLLFSSAFYPAAKNIPDLEPPHWVKVKKLPWKQCNLRLQGLGSEIFTLHFHCTPVWRSFFCRWTFRLWFQANLRWCLLNICKARAADVQKLWELYLRQRNKENNITDLFSLARSHCLLKTVSNVRNILYVRQFMSLPPPCGGLCGRDVFKTFFFTGEICPER